MGYRYFDGRNYAGWSVQMKLVLQQKCLWSLIDGRYQQPINNSPEARLAWEDKRDQALAAILLSMNWKVQPEYISETDPIKLWDTLAEKYGRGAPTTSEPSAARPEPSAARPEPSVTRQEPSSVEPTEHVSLQSVDDENVSEIQSNDWIIGVNNSAHVTPRKELFSRYYKYNPGQKKIQLTGTDQTLEALGYGPITLRFQGPDGTPKSLEIEALHAPKCRYNLLAFGKLGEKNLAFAEEGWNITNEDGTDYAHGPMLAAVPVIRTEESEENHHRRHFNKHRGSNRYKGQRRHRSNGAIEGPPNGGAAQTGSA